MEFNIQPIPQDKEHPWKWKINGQEVDVRHLEGESQYGRFKFGLHPKGFPVWGWYESGGGGAFTVPFARTPDGELLLGTIIEDRPNMGGQVHCAIGGFVDKGESHKKEAGAREAKEEAGITVNATPSPFGPDNCNRLYTWADVDNDEGNHTFFAELPFNTLTFLEEEQCWTLRPEIQGEISKGESGMIRLHPWRKAVEVCAGTIGRASLAQAIAHLL